MWPTSKNINIGGYKKWHDKFGTKHWYDRTKKIYNSDLNSLKEDNKGEDGEMFGMLWFILVVIVDVWL